MINHRTLGLSNFKVSELCLGTMHFGWRADEARAFEILDAFREAGGNFIQTVCYHPDQATPSTSPNRGEEVVGKWIKARGIPRPELVIASRLVIGRGVAPTSFARTLTAACHESAARLGTSYLDMVVLEWSDVLLPIAASFAAIDDLVRTGIVHEYGVAGFPPWRIADLIARAYLRNRSRLEMVQADYSLLKRSAFEGDLAELCGEQRLGFVARAPLAGGLLYQPIPAARPLQVRRRLGLRNTYPERRTTIELLAERLNATVPQIGLAWVLQNPALTSAIVGVRSADDLQRVIAACQIKLSDVDLADLEHPFAGSAEQQFTLA